MRIYRANKSTRRLVVVLVIIVVIIIIVRHKKIILFKEGGTVFTKNTFNYKINRFDSPEQTTDYDYWKDLGKGLQAGPPGDVRRRQVGT